MIRINKFSLVLGFVFMFLVFCVFTTQAAMIDMQNTWSATESSTAARYGSDVAFGDVNGDSYSDLIVGAYGYNSSAGRAYVYLGSASGLSNTPVWTSSGDNAGDDLEYAYCDYSDTGGCDETDDWSRYTVVSSGLVGEDPFVQIDSYDRPRISYYAQGDHDLKYVWCLGDSCDAADEWKDNTIDNSDDPGEYNALVLDNDNSPHFSYFEDTSDDVMYAYDNGVPSVSSFVIDNGAAYTNSTSVDLNSSVTDVTYMIFSTSSDFSDASFETYAATKSSFLISTGDGTKTVYGDYANDYGTEPSSSSSDTIILDQTNPSISVVFPSATYYNSSNWSTITGTASDALSGVASDTVTIQRNSDSKYWDGDSWETGSTNLSATGTTSWTYSLDAGNLDSGVQYTITPTATDNATNSASGTAQSFIYDSVASLTIATPAGGDYTSEQTVTLSATDATSGVAATYYTTDGSDPTTSSTQYTAPIAISETTTLKFFSTDNVGNSESVKTETYIISTTEEQQQNLRDGNRITVDSDLEGETISGRGIIIYFKKVAGSRWMQWKKYNKNPKSWKKSKTMKRYWKQSNNYTKSQKINYKITFKYTKKLFNQLKKKNKGLKKSGLTLKVKAGKNKWKTTKKIWKNSKLVHKAKKNRFVLKKINKFPKKTYQFGIGLK